MLIRAPSKAMSKSPLRASFPSKSNFRWKRATFLMQWNGRLFNLNSISYTHCTVHSGGQFGGRQFGSWLLWQFIVMKTFPFESRQSHFELRQTQNMLKSKTNLDDLLKVHRESTTITTTTKKNSYETFKTVTCDRLSAIL